MINLQFSSWVVKTTSYNFNICFKFVGVINKMYYNMKLARILAFQLILNAYILGLNDS